MIVEFLLSVFPAHEQKLWSFNDFWASKRVCINLLYDAFELRVGHPHCIPEISRGVALAPLPRWSQQMRRRVCPCVLVSDVIEDCRGLGKL